MSDPIGRWPVDESFPAVLRDCDLMRVIGLKHSRFYLRKKTGEFAFLELRPQLRNSATLYSGDLVRRWVTCAASQRSLRSVAS